MEQVETFDMPGTEPVSVIQSSTSFASPVYLGVNHDAASKSSHLLNARHMQIQFHREAGPLDVLLELPILLGRLFCNVFKCGLDLAAGYPVEFLLESGQHGSLWQKLEFHDCGFELIHVLGWNQIRRCGGRSRGSFWSWGRCHGCRDSFAGRRSSSFVV